jgi:hypothetical protein
MSMPFVFTPEQLKTLEGDYKWMSPLDKPFEEDFRVRLLSEHLDLSGLRVLEPGCLEGNITLSLLGRGAKVTSFDVRPANVAKTWIRGRCHGMHDKMDVRVGDALKMHEDFPVDAFDLIYHGGVFYHLLNPCPHLKNIAPLAKYLFLDTHVAAHDVPLYPGDFLSERVELHLYHEDGGWDDPAGGAQEYSMWLSKESILKVAKLVGLELVATVFEDEKFTMGPRIGWLFRRA